MTIRWMTLGLILCACGAEGGDDDPKDSKKPSGGGSADGGGTGSGAGPTGGAISTGGADATSSGGAPSGGTTGETGGTGASSGDGGNSGSGGLGGSVSESCRDEMGHTMFYQTASAGPIWSSAYWSGAAHAVDFGTPDPADPNGLANRRGTGEVTVNGDGTLSMTGSQPRLYLGTADLHPWKNVEVTVYYQRLEDDGTAWAGLVVGARGGPDGHGGDNCTATTYYARIRHDGNVDLEKELEHSASSTKTSLPLWDGADSPRDQWIGMKYIVTNTPQDTVRLQVFRDMTGGADGGTWEALLDEFDDGGWAPPHNCSYSDDYIILEGGGVVFIRNTGLTGPGALYRDVTVREVDPANLCSD